MIDAKEPVEVPRGKIVDYLLDTAHPRGGPKARFFLAFGFSPAEPDAMAEALIDHLIGERCSVRADVAHGRRRLIAEGPLATPDGRGPRVRTVWQHETGAGWRLVTAVPLTR